MKRIGNHVTQRPSQRRGQSAYARVFAALGDDTWLSLVTRSCGGRPSSIRQLTAGSRLTRQAITKHLRVLERTGIVHSSRRGRESVFQFDPKPIEQMQDYLALVSGRRDQALARLNPFAEG